MSEQKPKRFLREPEVISRTGLSHTQIYMQEKRGLFPKRVKITAKAAGWLEHEVEAYINQRVALSRGEPVAA